MDAFESQLSSQGFNQSIHYNKNPMIQKFLESLIANLQPQLMQQTEAAIQKYISGMDQLAAIKPEVSPATRDKTIAGVINVQQFRMERKQKFKKS